MQTGRRIKYEVARRQLDFLGTKIVFDDELAAVLHASSVVEGDHHAGSAVYAEAVEELRRPHGFAFERVGFFSAATAELNANRTLILFTKYHAVPDKHYLRDRSAGAMIGTDAIRAAMQRVLDERLGQVHVHLHDHIGDPQPSRIDVRDTPRVVRSLSRVGPKQTSGYIILSDDGAWAELVLPGQNTPILASKITVSGFPFRFLK